MPVIKESVAITQERESICALDSAGQTVKIGDTVTLTFEVTHIRCGFDPETGAPGRDEVELAIVKPNGYRLHFCTVDARMVQKQ